MLKNLDDVALFAQARLVAPEQVRLIPGSGVDCVRFVPAPTANASLRVLLLARLLWDKGLAEFVTAARTLHASGQAMHFWLAGTLDPGNPTTVREWKAEGVLKWLGHVSPSSTAVNRVGLHLLPLQRIVFAHLHEVLGHPYAANQGWAVAVLGCYTTMQFVWLNFATHAFAWLPYRFYPLEVLF